MGLLCLGMTLHCAVSRRLSLVRLLIHLMPRMLLWSGVVRLRRGRLLLIMRLGVSVLVLLFLLFLLLLVVLLCTCTYDEGQRTGRD
jgi:hypothetical protein